MTGGPIIHAARFGNRGGAHDVLQDTGAPRALLDGIKWYTDRPGTQRPADSDQTHAGYSSHGHYVVQCTEPDHQADRGGMVTTTALLVPADLVPEIDLGQAFDAVDDLAGRDALRLVDAGALGYAGACRHAPGADALLDALAAKQVAVWLGTGHREALACIWRHLGVADRTSLTFRATDHPDVTSLPRGSDALRVLVAPTPLPAAFAALPVVTADATAADGPAAAIFGPAGHPAALLASRLRVSKPDLREWRHLMALDRELRLLGDGGIGNTLGILGLLGLLAPDPATGSDVKTGVLGRLREQLAGQPYESVRGIRTVQWDALPEPDGRRTITAAWVRRAATDKDAASFTAALDDLQRRDGSWFPELRAEIAGALTADPHLTATVAAELLQRPDGREALRALTEDHAGASPEFDRQVSVALAGRAAAGWAADEAQQRRWATVHATVADITDAARVWRAHVPIATAQSVELLARRVATHGTVAAALELGHPLLVKQTGVVVAADPALLTPPQPGDPAYRNVWAAAIRNGMPAAACCPLADAAPVLLDAWLRGEDVDDVLLDAVRDDAGPILARHADLSRLWTASGSRVVGQLRTVVAAHVARTLTVDDPAPEPALAREILARPALTALARKQPTQAVTVLVALPGFTTDSHGVLVAENMTRTTPDTADRFGSLVRARHWRHTAWYLVTCGRADLEPAARQAVAILSFFDWLRLRGRTASVTAIPEPTDTELREVILDVLSEIYPHGPTPELWERSGGRQGELPQASTGRQAWHRALTAITAGRTGTPSMKRLLAEAHHEHQRNEQLRALHRYMMARQTWGDRAER